MSRFSRYQKNGTNLDLLTYAYDGNQLTSVEDASENDDGFKDGEDKAVEYEYDPNGNMESDENKSITHISYNHLNLPTEVTFSGGKSVKYVYDAAGIKLRKEAKFGNNVTVTDYVSGKHYVNDSLSFFPHGEGRVVYSAGSFNYEYNLTDHLGNVRVSLDSAGTVVQRDDYYPFGMAFQSWQKNPPKNLYGFQGQEYQEELGWHQYKWRNADPALGRFFNVDPLAEEYHYWTPYAFSGNMLTTHVELEGLEPVKHDQMQSLTNGIGQGALDAIVSTAETAWFLMKASSPWTPERQQLKQGIKQGATALGLMAADPYGSLKSVASNAETQVTKFQMASPEEQSYMLGRLTGEAGIGFVAEEGVGPLLKVFDAVGDVANTVNKTGKLIDTTPSVKSFKNGDKFDLDASLFENIINLNGRADLGWLTGNTANFEISAILKSPKSPKNSAFGSLISRLESIAKDAGMTDVRIDFQIVVNNRLKYDTSWAQEYGYFYSTYKDELGGINVVWEKEISN